MWKPKIYIGTSVFDCILSDNISARDCSLALLDRCRNETAVEGFISPFTIVELVSRYTEKQMAYLVELVNACSIKIVEYALPREIDNLVISCYARAVTIPQPYHIDYYHLATCSYLNLEYYVCWNKTDIVTFKTFRQILHSHIPRGYRSAINIVSPEYFIERECSEGVSAIIQHTEQSKSECLANLALIPAFEKAHSVQHQSNDILINQLKQSIQSIRLPNEVIHPSRLPMLPLQEVPLKFEVKSFEKEIAKKEIPLLDLDYPYTMFGMEYHMFRLTTLAGAQLLKEKQQELYYHMPTEFEGSEYVQLLAERNTDFVNWLLPRVRNYIETPQEQYNVVESGNITAYAWWTLEAPLRVSPRDNVVLAKQKALALVELITGGAWANYQGFLVVGPWCELNGNYDYGNTTYILTEKEGKEIWVILLNELIP